MPNPIPTSTRTFSFPNEGHSVRKLVASLRELGELPVTLVINEVINFSAPDNIGYEVSFTNDKYSNAPANLLATKLLTLGTRFTLKEEGRYPNNYQTLTFHTDFADIMANPDTYLN